MATFVLAYANGSLTSQTGVTHGFRPALAVAAGFSILGAAAALAIRRTAPAALTDSHRPSEVQRTDLAAALQTR